MASLLSVVNRDVTCVANTVTSGSATVTRKEMMKTSPTMNSLDLRFEISWPIDSPAGLTPLSTPMRNMVKPNSTIRVQTTKVITPSMLVPTNTI